MTTSCPTITELIEAVREFLEQEVQPSLPSPAAFHARVAVNALGIVQRELEQSATARDAEATRLKQLLDKDGVIDELTGELCRQLREGKIDYRDAKLLDHLRLTTLDRLAIDNPRYATYRLLIEARSQES